MMRTKLAVLGLFAAFALGAARGESTDIDSVTIGAMTERADLVALVERGYTINSNGFETTDCRVVELLRPQAGPERLTIWFGRQSAVRAPAGDTWLLFVRQKPDSKGAVYEPIAMPWGMRDAGEAGVKPLVDYTRRYAATLDKDGKLAKPSDLAALLVDSLGGAPGVPATAGRDLVRHFEELVPLMTPAQRQAVDAALAKPRKPDLDLASIIDAVGVAGTNAADDVLVARLLDPATRHLRLNITGALARHSRAELVQTLARRLDGASPQQRADLVNALGRIDRRDAAPLLLSSLADSESVVRVEAAHSVGLLARFVREPRAGVADDAPREKLTAALAPLLAALSSAKTETEKHALVWSVAQLDTPDAWDALKKLRDSAEDARVRELASQMLLHPRVGLILE